MGLLSGFLRCSPDAHDIVVDLECQPQFATETIERRARLTPAPAAVAPDQTENAMSALVLNSIMRR